MLPPNPVLAAPKVFVTAGLAPNRPEPEVELLAAGVAEPKPPNVLFEVGATAAEEIEWAGIRFDQTCRQS